MQNNQAELAKRDIGLAAISVDAPAAGKALAGKLGLSYPIVSDEKAASLRAFGIFDPETEIAWPSIFVVGKDGTIVKRWLADTFSERIPPEDLLRDL